MTRRRILLVSAVVVGVLCIAAAVLFKPWLVFVDTEVADALPQVAAGSSTGGVPTELEPAADAPSSVGAEGSVSGDPVEPAESAEPAPPPADVDPPEARQLSAGTFISHEHPTTGSVSVIEQPDGSRVLAIAGLDTTTGPDVHVWLSAADVIEGRDGWFTAGGAEFVDLGPLKGNRGDQLYEIPDDVDLGRFPAVDLWCVQFGVSFGAAQLL